MSSVHDSLYPWVTVIFWIMNISTFIITILNIFYLYKYLPNKKNEDNNTYIYRQSICKYYYIITIIPVLVSGVCHYGAIYPAVSIWIYPAMNIMVAISWILFLRVMVLSCDGWSNIEKILSEQQDECPSCLKRKCYLKCGKKLFCKLCLRGNAYLGLERKGHLCYLIMLKPIANYSSNYFLYGPHYGSSFYLYLSTIMRIIMAFTTIVAKQNMVSLHLTLLPYTRLKKSLRKRKFVGFLSPIIQLQQLVFGLIFDYVYFKGFGDIQQKYTSVIGFGIFLCFEMLICSVFVTKCIFNPEELKLWDDERSVRLSQQ